MSPAIPSWIAAMTTLAVERQEESAPGAGSIGETRRNDAGSGQGFCPVAGGYRGRSHAPDKGGLRVGENILLIVVGAGHRKKAFDVCEYILERIKESVPIWKKKIGEGGEHWVPGESHGSDA